MSSRTSGASVAAGYDAAVADKGKKRSDPGARVYTTRHFQADPRGTVLASETAPSLPEGWDGSKQFVRVEMDVGPKVWFPVDLLKLVKSDGYEKAYAEPEPFFADLLKQQKRDQVKALALVAHNPGYVTPLPLQGASGKMFRAAQLAPRMQSMMKKLAPARAMEIILSLIDGWTASPDYPEPFELAEPEGLFEKKDLVKGVLSWRYEDVVELLLSTLAWNALAEAAREPYDKLGDRFGAANAAKLGALLERLKGQQPGGRWFDREILKFLSEAREKIPGTLAPDTFEKLPSAKRPASDFGLAEGFVLP